MKRLKMLVLAASCLSVAVPVMVTPADAVVVRKTTVVTRGGYGYGHRAFAPRRIFRPARACRTTVVVSRGRKVTRRVCR